MTGSSIDAQRTLSFVERLCFLLGGFVVFDLRLNGCSFERTATGHQSISWCYEKWVFEKSSALGSNQ
jgi:hypothetical protein